MIMKKRFFSILLCLCLVLALFPVTAFAEGEALEQITQIGVEVEPPVVGEIPEYSWSTASTPTGVIDVDIGWGRISKAAYTGGADDIWEDLFGTGYTYSEDYYYMLVCSVQIYDRFLDAYVIPDDVNATINGKPCDIQVADNGKFCQMSYIFEAKVLQPVSNIAVTVDEPALGETPDFSPAFTADPDGSVTLDEVYWYKISVDDFTGTNEDIWDEMSEDEVFEGGYYYSVDLYFDPNEDYYFTEEMTATVNGKPHDDTYGSVYDEDDYFPEAYVCGFFDPLEPQCTLTVPFTTTVELGGDVAPGKTVFDLEVVGTNAGDATYADVTVSGSVTTNGAGVYEGVMTFTGPFRQLRNMLCEGAFVQQVDAGKEGWTYDDTVWGLLLWEGVIELSTDDAAPEYAVLILPATCEKTDDGMYYDLDWNADPLDEMSFTNTYTESAPSEPTDPTEPTDPSKPTDPTEPTDPTKPTEPTKPAESNPNNGAASSPQTGDNSNLTLWFAMLAVSAAGVIGTGVYSKRRRSSRAN